MTFPRERIYADPALATPDKIREQGRVERETPTEIVIRSRLVNRRGMHELSHWRSVPLNRHGYWENWRTVEVPPTPS